MQGEEVTPIKQPYTPDPHLSVYGGLHSNWTSRLQDLEQQRINMLIPTRRAADWQEQLQILDARIREARTNICADYDAQLATLRVMVTEWKESYGHH